MIWHKQNWLAALFLCVVAFLFQACSHKQEFRLIPKGVSSTTPERTEIVITAVGDVMMPAPTQAVAARDKRGYNVLFEKVADDLRSADITFANLETPVDQDAAVSGYPRFNARPALLSALRNIGVGIVSVANNHIMDRGTGGLKRTLGNIEATGIVFVGAGRTKAEASAVRHMKAKDVNVAFLAYTYITNERLPSIAAAAPGVNIFRTKSEADLSRVVKSVREAKASADLVVVSLHWGDEYAPNPTPWQRRAASELIEAGADVIFGHHPHVLQPIERYSARDGRVGLIAFSLGNFISCQNAGITSKNRDNLRALRGDSIVLNVFAEKEGGKTRISRVEFLPIWSLRELTDGGAVYRPVILERELSLLATKQGRSESENGVMKLLNYRRNSIVSKLTGTLE